MVGGCVLATMVGLVVHAQQTCRRGTKLVVEGLFLHPFLTALYLKIQHNAGLGTTDCLELHSKRLGLALDVRDVG